MIIHPIQTGTVRVKQFQLTGARNNLSRFYQLILTQKWSEWMPIYSWLIELENKLILIDTGETSKIYTKGYLPKGGLYHKAVQTKIKTEEEIPVQIRALGYKPQDINTIILTHLHGDHIGGIEYFEHAEILVNHLEYELAKSKKGPQNGYFTKNWPTWFTPKLIKYNNQTEDVFTQSYRVNSNDQIIIVPTPGHSVGHQSIILKTSSNTYFIGGDLTYNIKTLKSETPNVVIANKDAQESVSTAHKYVKNNSCIYLSSHDWKAPQMIIDNITYENT